MKTTSVTEKKKTAEGGGGGGGGRIDPQIHCLINSKLAGLVIPLSPREAALAWEALCARNPQQALMAS